METAQDNRILDERHVKESYIAELYLKIKKEKISSMGYCSIVESILQKMMLPYRQDYRVYLHQSTQ